MRESLAVATRLGDSLSRGVALQNLAGLLRRQGRLEEAHDTLASEMSAEMRDDAYMLQTRACIAYEMGHLHEAVRLHERCAQVAEAQGLAKPLRMALCSMNNLLPVVGNLAAALEARRRLARLLAQDGRDTGGGACAICLRDLEGADATIVPECFHIFCRDCAEESGRRPGRSCPACRG
mmetsp:Transcript_9441/g.27876  ORF Transcript_9441/g.27876 Transcript_9441/m.27876 type:complete len:179 (+) Transcript_9441:1-537(+)